MHARNWLRQTAIVAGCAAAMLMSATTSATDQGPRDGPRIQVERGAWGTARVRDIEEVLTSVAAVLAPSFPQHASALISVEYSRAGPAVLFEKSAGGAYRVLLNVQDTRWDQFAYQFSHELCHIYSNFEHREIDSQAVVRNHQWLEESMCEGVSILALKRVAAAWEQSPPHPRWNEYSSAFRDYARRLVDEPHRRPSSNTSVAKWYRANQRRLDADPYARRKNEFLAARLLTCLENTPGGLESIGYLNLDASRTDIDIGTYLNSWYSHCPEKYRAFISQVIALLGEVPAGGTTAAIL
jgi:hypothetical protein